MEKDRKEFIHELQKTLRAAMGLADAAATAMIDDSGIPLIDMKHHLQYVNKCLASTGKMVDQEIEKNKKGTAKPTKQEFIRIGDFVKVDRSFLRCTWASTNTEADYYAELTSQSGTLTTVALRDGQFIITSPRKQQSTTKMLIKNPMGARRCVVALSTKQGTKEKS